VRLISLCRLLYIPFVKAHPSTGEPMPNRLRTPYMTAAALGFVLLGLLSCSKKEQQAGVDTGAGTAMMPDTSANRSLYDRLGGKSAITAVVDTFVARVAADTRINKKFARSNIPRVKAEIVDQVCAETGGPCTYTGRSMKEAHRNMRVTEGEFNALVEDLTAALNVFNVPAREQKELLDALGTMKNDIVEVHSSETGTNLPAGFKPAPPL
jgi:hemoglobin